MNWKAKAFLQKVLGWLPFGNNINYLFQTKITKNLPVSDKIFFEKVSLAKYHYDNFSKYHQNITTDSYVFYEFGAGWDLIIPMIYFVKGVNNQILIDINKKLKFRLINYTVWRFNKDQKKIESYIGDFINQMPDVEINNLKQLRQFFGIEYIAPMDASNSFFKDNHFDFISNTSTFEHIPEQFILPIMKECHRILKDNSIMSCVIDLQDHYSYFDNQISVYNFLQYSDKMWAKYNHPIQYQNRLRSSDYIKSFIEAGFEILDTEKEFPNVTEEKALKSIKIDEKFSKYSYEDLSVKVLKIVLRKVKY